MQLKSLRIFDAVCSTGSFGAAAQRLHTVQSNVTAHIKKLEEELKVQLMERSNGPVRLTPAGHTLLPQAQRLLQTHDDTCALFAGEVPPAGSLRIGAMESTAALRLPSVLAKVYQAHPHIDLQLRTGPTAALLDDLVRGALDCAFVAGQPPNPRWWAQPVFQEELVLVGPTPMQTLPAPEVLLHTPFLAFRQGCSYRQRIELLLASQGITSTRIMELGTLDAILGCVAAGMGFALMPLALMQTQQSRFGTHCVRLPEPLRSQIGVVDTWLVAPEQQGWSPQLRALVDKLAPLRVSVEA
ncbi:MAG: LysR family transcriptional regulator [Comamonas sp.]